MSRLFAVVLATAAAGRGQAYELRGRVVDEAFGPLAGAALAAGRSGALETTAVLAAPAATSAADGSFRLRFEPARDAAAVLVTAPGRAGLCLEVASLREAPPGVLDVGDLPLPPGTLRLGRVVDAAGAPIAGARIEVLDAISSGEAFPGEPERKARYAVFARSDDRGVFRLPGVAPGMRAEVSADGYATRQIAHLAASTPTTIELLATGQVAGRVVDAADERPLAASVQVAYLGGGTQQTQATADGRFRLYLVSTGRYQLAVHVPGYQRFTGDWLDAPRDDLVVALQRTGVRLVPVQAKDAVTGEPVRAFRAAVVWLAHAASAWPRLGDALDSGGGEAANDDGVAHLRFPVPDMPPQVQPFVGVRAPGYTTAIASNIEHEPVVALERAAVIEGVVRDAATAAPLAGVLVWAFPILRDGNTAHPDGTDTLPQPPGAVRTDAQGAFRLEGLRPGGLVVHARHPQRPTAHQQVEVTAGATLRVTCPVVSGCRLRVVAEEGAPPGAMISLMPRLIAGGRPGFVTELTNQHLAYQRAIVDGVAVFEGLPELEYKVALRLPVAARSGPPIHAFFAEVKLGAEPATLELGRHDAARVRGRITVHHGELPVDQLLVVAVPPAAWLRHVMVLCRRAFVAADGSFDLAVAPGSHRLCAFDLRTGLAVHVGETIEVQGSMRHDLELRPATLVVRPSARSPAPRDTLRLWVERMRLLDEPGVAWSEQPTGPSLLPLDPGAAEWRLPVAAGPIRLLAYWWDADSSEPLPPPETFELTAGATTELELRVFPR